MVGCREKLGDFEGAEQLCNLAFKADHNEPNIYLVRGNLYLKQNYLKRALMILKKAKKWEARSVKKCSIASKVSFKITV